MVGFHDLYERHWRDVYRFALFLSGNPAHAEDLTSDTFVRAWNARGSFEKDANAAGFAAMAWNACGCPAKAENAAELLASAAVSRG